MVTGLDEVRFTTEDHKPNNTLERERIEAGGGTVRANRVNGMLAVSRALGDFEMKKDVNRDQTKQLVSAEADVTAQERDPNDNFILICCDGVYDVQTNFQLVKFINDRLPSKYHLKDLMEELINYCCFTVSL